MNISEVNILLKQKSQEHIFTFLDKLNHEEQLSFIKQIENINWSYLSQINTKESSERGTFTPPAAISIEEIEKNKEQYTATGLHAIKNGEVAAVLLAGETGTRLDFDLPKGCFNVWLTHSLYIFECLIYNLLEVVNQTGVCIPLYIMTSKKNDEVTQSFFEENNYFGYDKNYIKFFIQNMVCAVDFDGKLLLEAVYREGSFPFAIIKKMAA